MHVYLITNLVTGHLYVGMTTWSIQSRWKVHLKKAKAPKTDFHRALASYGERSFSLELLEKCYTSEALDIAERKWIKKLRSQDPAIGYNRTSGGQRGELSKEARAKISKAMKGRKKSQEHRKKLSDYGKSLTGERNNFYGKAHSKLTKEKLSISMRGELGPCFGRSGKRHPFFGKHHSDAAKRKMSERSLGRPLSIAHKERIKAWHAHERVERDRRDRLVARLVESGLPRSEIADQLGIALTTVYNALWRVRKAS